MQNLTLETGLALTDTGRALLFAPNDYAPTIRRAYKQAANNGNSNACTILRGIMPDVDNDEETCPECFAPLDAEPDAFSECWECDARLKEWNAAHHIGANRPDICPDCKGYVGVDCYCRIDPAQYPGLAERLADSARDDSPAFD